MLLKTRELMVYRHSSFLEASLLSAGVTESPNEIVTSWPVVMVSCIRPLQVYDIHATQLRALVHGYISVYGVVLIQCPENRVEAT
jgi:hypothetical protein